MLQAIERCFGDKLTNAGWADKLKKIPQYVITLSGVLEFMTLAGETFTGDVLVAEDHTGSGHKWRLINDEPWKRAYVIFKEGANTQFVPDRAMP